MLPLSYDLTKSSTLLYQKNTNYVMPFTLISLTPSLSFYIICTIYLLWRRTMNSLFNLTTQARSNGIQPSKASELLQSAVIFAFGSTFASVCVCNVPALARLLCLIIGGYYLCCRNLLIPAILRQTESLSKLYSKLGYQTRNL